MRSTLSRVAPFLLYLSLACAIPQLLAKKKDLATPTDPKRAVHALNRLTFGPRPGDVQRVVAMGVDRWIDLQLHPDKIADNDLAARLTSLRTLHMSSKEILEEFPDGQMIRQVASGKRPMPSDPVRRAVYQVQIARLEERQERKQEKAERGRSAAASISQVTEPSASDNARTEEELAAAAAAESGPTSDSSSMNAIKAKSDTDKTVEDASADTNAGAAGLGEVARSEIAKSAPPKATPAEEAAARRLEQRLYADLEVEKLIDLSPNDRYKKILSMSPDEQFAFAKSLKGGKGQEFLEGLDPKQRESLLAMNNPQAVVVDELSQAKLLRAIYSERQLEEVMTDFWFNHFNIFVGKGPERLLLTPYEQSVIRPHAMGKFEDLLVATAKSPAMLYYLDNWLSVGPNSLQATGAPMRPMMRRRRYGPRQSGQKANAKGKKSNGLNENYGRELLELHTLSVNGGYSQRDVTEVAKVFTGWTIDRPEQGMNFRYDPRMHEPGPKFVLGHHIKPGGEDEGREVLHVLATSPQTAHFISLKLAERFVSDDPPAELVDRMTKTFQKKKGDIREVLSTLFHSPEFWAEGAYRAKVKTPLEFVASAIRATGASVDDALPLARQLSNMGMPLYGAQPPTGYSMKGEMWVSSSALLNRMNFALALTSGKVRGVKIDTGQLVGDSPVATDVTATLSRLEATLLEADVSKQTHESIVAQIPQSASSEKKSKAAQSKSPEVSGMAGLLLGSPEFQRR